MGGQVSGKRWISKRERNMTKEYNNHWRGASVT